MQTELDIIIPLYNRGTAIIPTIQSLLLQTKDDFTVTFVLDGEDAVAENVIERYYWDRPHNIYVTPHEGVGSARDTGLDYSVAPYVMFLDSDDLLLPNAVGTILNAINHGFDMMVGKTMREAENGNFEVVGGAQMTWIHGRVYSREFLRKYDIVFPDLPMCEDLSFNMICAEFAQRVPETQWPIHIQRYTHGSLSRSKGSLRLQAETYIEACIFYVDRAAEFKPEEELSILPAALAACYYYLDSVEREFPGDAELYHKMCEQFWYLIRSSHFAKLNAIPEWQSRFAMALATPARPFKKTYVPALTFEQWVVKAKEVAYDGQQIWKSYFKSNLPGK